MRLQAAYVINQPITINQKGGKKINKRVLVSVFVLGIVVTLAGAGTWAAFKDTEASTGNTFSSGTLDVKLPNDGSTYTDGVTATWASPANFKPGDTFGNELHFTNVGSVNINHLYMYPEDLTNSGGTGGVKLSDKIIITRVTGHITRDGSDLVWGNTADFIGRAVGNHDGTLTLIEFCNAQFVAYCLSPIIFGIFPPILKAGDHNDWGLIIEGKFADDADNHYQGSSCTFNMICIGSQNSPTKGFEEITGDGT